MKYYIASKLENHAAHNRLRDVLAELGHQITYDWTPHGPVYGSGLDRVREVAELETKGVLDADFVVVLWPGGRGTHVELGMALAADKPVIYSSATCRRTTRRRQRRARFITTRWCNAGIRWRRCRRWLPT